MEKKSQEKDEHLIELVLQDNASQRWMLCKDILEHLIEVLVNLYSLNCSGKNRVKNLDVKKTKKTIKMEAGATGGRLVRKKKY